MNIYTILEVAGLDKKQPWQLRGHWDYFNIVTHWILFASVLYWFVLTDGRFSPKNVPVTFAFYIFLFPVKFIWMTYFFPHSFYWRWRAGKWELVVVDEECWSQAVGRSQCFESPSVIWQCWSSDRKDIQPIQTCATYPQRLCSRTSGGKNIEEGRFRFWKTAVNTEVCSE